MGSNPVVWVMTAEIGAEMLDFFDRPPIPAVRLSEHQSEVAGITYRIRGAGPPLVLMTLSLARRNGIR